MKQHEFMGAGWTLGLIAATLLMWLLLGIGNIYWSDLNQDEGWYVYAADKIVDGHMPYRDFAFTQGPVMPYIYGLIRPALVDTGMVGMRWFTLLLFLPTLCLAAATAHHSSPGLWRMPAGLCCLMLLAINAYHSQYTCIVKTYSLCLLLLTGGIALLARAASSETPWRGLSAGFLMGLAACTRLSAGFFLAGVCIYALLHPTLRQRRTWFYTGLGGAAAITVGFLPFFVTAPEQFIFCLFDYHTGREAGGLLASLVYKGGFLSRFVGDYLMLSILTMCWLLLLVLRPGHNANNVSSGHPLPGMLLCGALFVTVVHALAPFPYDDYQVITIPAFAIAVSVGLAHLFNRQSFGRGADTNQIASTWAKFIVLTVFFACTAAAWSSPVNQAWVLREQDRIWWRLKEQSPMQQLQDTAAILRQQMPAGSEFLTQDLVLAVEAGLRVPPGLEMGPFSYFPSLDDHRAATLHVMNQTRLLELLQTTEAPMAATSGYTFTIASPDVRELELQQTEEFLSILNERYRVVEQIPHFGQGHTTLRLYAKKAEP